MNVTSLSPAMVTSLAKSLTPVTNDPAAKTDDARETGSTSAYGSAKEGASPGQDVAKKLKDMSKALVALTLIQDPMERAKAAARLYKQYSQVAKDYADATAGGREAAQAASAQNAAQNAGQQLDENGQPIDPQAAAPAPDAAAAPVVTPLVPPAGAPRFAADIYMEEIKTFAGAAKQMYDAAVQEAKLKKLTGKDKDDGSADIEDGKKVLTEAAKAVEGPDATDEVQMPKGAGSVVNLSA